MATDADRRRYRFLWRAHKAVWRASGGRLMNRMAGMPVLELTTIGRVSGEPRSVLLTYVEAGDGYAVIASNAGHPSPPQWYLNLQADPAGRVRVGGRKVTVTARQAAGPERDALWSLAVEAHPGYEGYAAAAGRVIPVVVLEPRP